MEARSSCLTHPLADIQSVAMATPDAVAKVRGAAPADVIAALEPVIKQYAGLPTDWVVDAMAQLADAYDTAGQAERATATYDQINLLYPNSGYQIQAVAGKARQGLKLGKIDEALPLAADRRSGEQESRSLARAGTALRQCLFGLWPGVGGAKKNRPRHSRLNLTVKTMFYTKIPALVEQAEQLTRNLRDQNPGLGID